MGISRNTETLVSLSANVQTMEARYMSLWTIRNKSEVSSWKNAGYC